MICGIDEAGRGPIIGPLVIAGVLYNDDLFLKKNNVKDSKKINRKNRDILAKIIKNNAINFKIIIISASDIDDMRKIMTLNEIEVNAFVQIINFLKPKICYLDAVDVNEERFKKNIKNKIDYQSNIISKHKADEIYPIVSAASILAKSIRDSEITKISKELERKIDLPLGSGYPSDRVTIKFLKSWLKKFGELPPYVRHSWKTSNNLISEYKNKKIYHFNLF
jgi:ribonuclease HII